MCLYENVYIIKYNSLHIGDKPICNELYFTAGGKLENPQSLLTWVKLKNFCMIFVPFREHSKEIRLLIFILV